MEKCTRLRFQSAPGRATRRNSECLRGIDVIPEVFPGMRQGRRFGGWMQEFYLQHGSRSIWLFADYLSALHFNFARKQQSQRLSIGNMFLLENARS